MGCTSSAPNMSEQHAHTTENEKRESDDDKHDADNVKKVDTIKNKDSEKDESTNIECNEIEMLPNCDTLDQNIQLDRKPDIVIDEQERDMADINVTEVNVSMEIEKEIPSIELQEDSHKFPTFKDVVEKVALESNLENVDMPGVEENDDKTTEDNEIQDNPIIIKNASSCGELEEINDDEENLGEAASPSQSECSRATRWEALADIAAELPPSLTVDPVTGQIFSLTK